MQVVEDDVDQIAVVGEEEEEEEEKETRVRISSICIFFSLLHFFIICLLSGLAPQAGECQKNWGQIFDFSKNTL